MRHTVVGVVADELGHAYHPMARTRASSAPASEYRAVQPERIPVDLDHDGQSVGRVIYLERSGGCLWAVAEVDAEPTVSVRVGADTVEVGAPLYFSAERVSTPDDRDFLLRSVALTHWPARVAARPLRWYEGGLIDRCVWNLDAHDRGPHRPRQRGTVPPPAQRSDGRARARQSAGSPDRGKNSRRGRRGTRARD